MSTTSGHKMQPLVSIITVVYNGEKTLAQTIESVKAQTYNTIEYIIVDGASKDGTLDIVKRYEGTVTTWISEPDKGLYDAMNKGIGMANGEIIGMINSDDWYEPDAVETIVNAYNKHPEKKIFHGERFDVQENGEKEVRKFHPSSFKLKYYGMTFNHPSMFMHRDVYKDHLYNTELRALSDYEFVLTEFMKDKNQFHYIPKGYVNYRLDGVSATMGFKDEIREGVISRKNAGLNWLQRSFSSIFSASIWGLFKLIRS